MEKGTVNTPDKAGKPNDSLCKTYAKKGHSYTACRSQNFRVYCKTKGYLRTDCFKLKKRQEREQHAVTIIPATAGSTVQTTSDQQSTIAFVHPKNGRILHMKSNVFSVCGLNNRRCNLTAILDTGSPISFVYKSCVYKQFLNVPLERLEFSKQSYTSLNNIQINLYGSIQTSICLEQLPNLNANIILYVFRKLKFSGPDYWSKFYNQTKNSCF